MQWIILNFNPAIVKTWFKNKFGLRERLNNKIVNNSFKYTNMSGS